MGDDEGSVVKLAFAVLIRVSERWGKKCFSAFEQHLIRSVRQRRQLDEHEEYGDIVNRPSIPEKCRVRRLICLQEPVDLTGVSGTARA
jgi:hypothetical protein